jgi:hypothetical protein
MIEQQIRDLFAETAGREPPAPAQVDLQAARRRGRAMLRWRRAGLTGASVLVAALVATLVVVVPAGPAPRPAVTGPAAPLHFSPLVTNLSFGWLPRGVSIQQGGFLPTEVYAQAGRASEPIGGWSIEVYARGRCHLTGSAQALTCSVPGTPGSDTEQISAPAPPAAGHRAFWAGRILIWSYARGGWALLGTPAGDYAGLQHDPALQREAIRMAAHLHVGADTPHLIFAERFTNLTGRWRITDLHYFADKGTLQAWEFTLLSETSRFLPHVGDLGIWTNGAYVMGHPAPGNGTCSPDDPSTQNTREVINGFHMVLKRGHAAGRIPTQEVCGAHAGGLWFDLEEFGSHPPIGVTKLFRDHVHLLGRNPASWTQDPLG